MLRSAPIYLRFLLPVLGVVALWLGGCSENEGINSATEVDEPNYREGQSLLKTGRKQEALNAFLKVLAKRGDDAPESHLEVGLLYLQHINDPLSAIYHFRKYLALRPNSPQAPLVRQRIDAATREFARTLPAQPLEAQLQRVDLVATLDRLKQENESLKQELADLKSSSGRSLPAVPGSDGVDQASTPPEGAAGAVNFSVETIPTVRTRPAVGAPVRSTAPAPARGVTLPVPSPAGVTAKPVGIPAVRKHTVKPGDTLFKLALQYYNNRAKWRDILAANRAVMRSETDLKVGMELKIP